MSRGCLVFRYLHRSRQWMTKRVLASIALIIAIITVQVSAQESGLTAVGGRRMPPVLTNTIPLEYSGRYLLIQREESGAPLKSSSTATYYLEPPLFLVPVTNDKTHLPNWIHEVDYESNGNTKIKIVVALKNSILLDAAVALVTVMDIEALQERAREENEGRPLTVMVKPMPIEKIRLEFLDTSGKGEVLAFGEAEVSRTPEEKDVWLHMEPGMLQRILDLWEKDRLDVRPFYSYSHIVMTKAWIHNFGTTEVRDRLEKWLNDQNLTGDGDISQKHIDEFNRDFRPYIQSKIWAERPEPAGFLVNNVTRLTDTLFVPAEQIPFVRGDSQIDEHKLAEHLGALGWVKSTGDVWESVVEESKSKGTKEEAKVEAGVANKKGIGAQFGFKTTQDQVDATLRRTGVVMTKNTMTQGWMPSRIQKYRVSEQAINGKVEYEAHVSIGIGTVSGFFNGESVNVKDLNGDGVAEWSEGFFKKMHGAERSRKPLRSSFAAASEVHKAVGQVKNELPRLQELLAKVDEFTSARESLINKVNATATLNGKIEGIRDSVEPFFRHHRFIDEEEASAMRLDSEGMVSGAVPPLERQRDELQAEVTKLSNLSDVLRNEIEQLVKSRAQLMDIVVPIVTDEEVAQLPTRVRAIVPVRPTFVQTQIVDDMEALLNEWNEARNEMIEVMERIKQLEIDFLTVDEMAPGVLAQLVKGLMEVDQRESKVAHQNGTLEGMTAFSGWYVATTGHKHDAGDAEMIRRWSQSERLDKLSAEIKPQEDALRAELPVRAAQISSHRKSAGDCVAEIKKNTAQFHLASVKLAKIEAELEQSVRRLQVTLVRD